MEIPAIQACAVIQTYLSKLGIQTVQHNSFEHFSKTFKKLTGRKPSGQFSYKSHNLHEKNSTWLEWRKEGKTVATHAMRLEDVSGELSLHDIWYQELTRIYGGGILGDNQPIISKEMTGKIVYAGEYFLSERLRGYSDLPSAMALLTFFVGELRWRPDWIYGFMNPKLAAKYGFNNRVGYASYERRGTHWIDAPKDVNPDDCLVYINRTQLIERIGFIGMSGLDAWIDTQ